MTPGSFWSETHSTLACESGLLGGGNSNMFFFCICSPLKNWGRWSNFYEHIFQLQQQQQQQQRQQQATFLNWKSQLLVVGSHATCTGGVCRFLGFLVSLVRTILCRGAGGQLSMETCHQHVSHYWGFWKTHVENRPCEGQVVSQSEDVPVQGKVAITFSTECTGIVYGWEAKKHLMENNMKFMNQIFFAVVIY